jgi:hypothetical protein
MFITAISAALAGTPVMAATSISSGFTAATLDTGLASTYTSAGTTLTLGGTAAFTGGATGDHRSYVGTVGTDYATSTSNWTATIEVQTAGLAGAQLYFGLGTGTTPGLGDPAYATPQGATAGEAAAFIYMHAPGNALSLTTIRKQSNQGYWSGEVSVSDATFDTIAGTTGGVATDSFYRYTMAFNYAAQTLTFDVDQISAFGGTVTSSGAANAAVMSLAGMGYDGSNGKIMFGGNNNTFDNLNVNVVPEPGAALIGGLGMLCLLRRRRA